MASILGNIGRHNGKRWNSFGGNDDDKQPFVGGCFRCQKLVYFVAADIKNGEKTAFSKTLL